MIEPHGGRLVNRAVDSDKFASEVNLKLSLSTADLQNARNIANGRFSPLRGFLNRNDFLKVVHDMTLEDGTVWPLPIVLDITAEEAAKLEPDDRATLQSPNGSRIGVIDIDEIYRYNETEAAEAIFGTNDESHPGVASFYERGDFFVGGPIRLFETHRDNDSDLLPKESRVLFKHYGWETIVGFQTRNAPHRAHEYIQKAALELVDGLLIQPKLGEKKSGDYRDVIIIEAYQRLIDAYYPDETVALSVFPSRMRYAGPREAVFDAIVRKNQGCTHFIIGRDHAGVADYYDGFDAHRIFNEITDIGIQPIFFDFAFYCESCDGMASEKICPHRDADRVYPSGSDIRDEIGEGNRPSKKVMRSEVASFIIDSDQPFVS